MDSVNTNKLAKDMRPELLGAKLQKNRLWVDNVDDKVKAKLGERIKILNIKKPEDDGLKRGEGIMVDDQGIHTPLESIGSARNQSTGHQPSIQKSSSTKNM